MVTFARLYWRGSPTAAAMASSCPVIWPEWTPSPIETPTLTLRSAHCTVHVCIEIHVHVLMRDERRKEERSKQGQTSK